MEYFGKLQIDTREIERSAKYFRPPWTNIDYNRFEYELCAIRRGASNKRYQAETVCILNGKYEHHSKIYTDGSKKDEKVGYAVVLSESTINKKTIPTNSIYSAEQSAIINANYSIASYNQKRVNITDSLSTIIAVSDRKRSMNPKTQLIRKLIDQASTNITLLWVPSHIPGNEAADDAAKEALNENTTPKHIPHRT
jgi:ribonuclease HI